MGKLLTERLAFSGGKVDRTGPRPVVREVLLCGPESANRRRYKAEAFAGERIKRYAGVPVFLNHGKPRESRRYEDRIAKVVNPRHRADGMPVGDLEVRPKHPYAEQFLDDAENDPKSCGMSHVANCETVTSKDGWEDITEVVSVESVDLVLDPATTRGLHEGKSVNRISLKQFAERFGPKWGAKRWAAVTQLIEDMGAPMDAPVMDAPPEAPADDGAADEGDLKSALIAALAPFLDAAFDSGDSEALCKACKDFVKLHAKHTGKGDDDKSGKGDSDVKDDKPADKESKQLPAPWDVLRECRAEGYTPTDTELETLALQPDAAKRKAFVVEQKKKAADARAEKPKSGQRAPGAGDTKTESEKPVPTDGKAFAESVRG